MGQATPIIDVVPRVIVEVCFDSMHVIRSTISSLSFLFVNYVLSLLFRTHKKREIKTHSSDYHYRSVTPTEEKTKVKMKKWAKNEEKRTSCGEKEREKEKKHIHTNDRRELE
jgi:hypothetical protein